MEGLTHTERYQVLYAELEKLVGSPDCADATEIRKQNGRKEAAQVDVELSEGQLKQIQSQIVGMKYANLGQIVPEHILKCLSTFSPDQQTFLKEKYLKENQGVVYLDSDKRARVFLPQ